MRTSRRPARQGPGIEEPPTQSARPYRPGGFSRQALKPQQSGRSEPFERFAEGLLLHGREGGRGLKLLEAWQAPEALPGAGGLKMGLETQEPVEDRRCDGKRSSQESAGLSDTQREPLEEWNISTVFQEQLSICSVNQCFGFAFEGSEWISSGSSCSKTSLTLLLEPFVHFSV